MVMFSSFLFHMHIFNTQDILLNIAFPYAALNVYIPHIASRFFFFLRKNVIQWNLSVLQEISGRTDGIMKPWKDTQLLLNCGGYESGL